MIGNIDLDLLEKTYQNASIGITAIESVLDKASSKGFSQDLHKQLEDYRTIADQSRQQLIDNGAQVKDKSAYDKAMMKGNIKLNTLVDPTDSHIAEMVIKGSTMGITQMTKLLHAHGDADGNSAKIAKDFIQKEQQNIEVMKNYL